MALTLALFTLWTTFSVFLADYNSDKELHNEILKIKEMFQHEVDNLRETIHRKDIECRQHVDILEERLRNMGRKNEATNMRNTKNVTKKKYDIHNNIKDFREQSLTRRAFGDGNVAFTAYLDHDIDNIGHTQTIEFNHVLLNHGNAYNNYTNVFTAPITGVYSFSFFIGQRGVSNEAQATLRVNIHDQVSAAVETIQDHQDSQGGNTANVLLNKGDTVYVHHIGGGLHVEGNSRTTTFSGFLLFPVETEAIIG